MTKARLCDVKLALSCIRLAGPKKPDPQDDLCLREMKAGADLASRVRELLEAKRLLGTGPMGARGLRRSTRRRRCYGREPRDLRNDLNKALAPRTSLRAAYADYFREKEDK